MRAKEAWQLRAHIDRVLETSPDANLMLFGDLNDTKNHYAIRQIIGAKGTPSHMMDLSLEIAATNVGRIIGKPLTNTRALTICWSVRV